MYLKCRKYKKTLRCTDVQCTLVHVYVHIKKLSLRAAVVANRLVTTSMLGCQIDGFVASQVIQGVSDRLKL